MSPLWVSLFGTSLVGTDADAYPFGICFFEFGVSMSLTSAFMCLDETPFCDGLKEGFPADIYCFQDMMLALLRVLFRLPTANGFILTRDLQCRHNVKVGIISIIVFKRQNQYQRKRLNNALFN